MTDKERPPRDADAVIVGGGFYGAHIATFVARHLSKVVLFERESTLLSRASSNNQARVHGGYHYPRSILTSLRSRRNYPRFGMEYADAIDRSFTNLYAIARRQSKVTSTQFVEFCRRIDAPLKRIPDRIHGRFNRDLVEGVFEVDEAVFSAPKLAACVQRGLDAAGVRQLTGIPVTALEPGTTRRHKIRWGPAPSDWTETDWVFLCTYSALNEVLTKSGLPLVPLQHEITEIALLEMPESLRPLAITVMDGPFWSTMPFPSAGVHSLSHVTYTPHASWTESTDAAHVARATALLREPRASHFPHMQRDAARYLPEIRSARYAGSLWEVKTILPLSHTDDSRPILAREVPGAPGVVTVLGAKIDSVYDVEDVLLAMLRNGEPT